MQSFWTNIETYGSTYFRSCLALICIFQVNNPLAHEYTTGPEIIEAVVSTPSTSSKPSSEKVDVMVASAGTGGTVTGLSRAIKKTHNPACIIVGVDPVCLFLTFVLCGLGSHFNTGRKRSRAT